jgi:hypothetical protein
MLGKGGALIVVCIALSLRHASGFLSGFSSAASLAPLRNSQNARYGGRATSSQPPLRPALAAAAALRQCSTVQTRMQATSGIIISEVDDYTEIRSIASFFVEAFWAQVLSSPTRVQNFLRLCESFAAHVTKVGPST